MGEPKSFLEIFGLVEPVWHVCPKCQQEHAWRGVCWDCRKEREQKQAQRDVLQKLDRTVPSEFAQADFAFPWLTERVSDTAAQLAAHKAARSPDTVRVVLMGGSGAGKTTLAVAMLRTLAALRGLGGQFMTAFDVKTRGIDPEWIEAGVLLIDDLGREDEFHKPRVSELIYRRRHSLRPTIVTTGFGHDTLTRRYGDQDARRLFEGAVVIDVGAKSAA